MRVDITSIVPASTACSIGTSVPSILINANANGCGNGCFSDGSAIHVQPTTVPPGPTSTNSAGADAPVRGSYSRGGQEVRAAILLAINLPSRNAVRNGPTNGPVVRVYGYSSVLTVSMVSLTAKVEHVCAGAAEWRCRRWCLVPWGVGRTAGIE